MGVTAAILLAVFGNIGEDRKIAERANHAQGLIKRQRGKFVIQLGKNARLIRLRGAMKCHRQLANLLGFLKRVLT